MLDAKTYWVGEKPGGVSAVTVLDSDGNPANLTPFTSVRLRMLDTDNNEVEIASPLTTFSDKVNGIVTFTWPADRSLFQKPGEYLLQLELSTPSAKRYTSVAPITVKRFGGGR